MFLSQLLVFVALLTAQQLHAVEPVEIDYARANQREAWLRDAACGEASCDAFVHDPQPVMRGSAEMAWSVNPSLTIDRTSGAWYAYVGCYPSGYTLRPPPEHMHSRLWRSRDRGATWEALGPVLPERFTLSGVRWPITHAPDVSVIEADGRWHMAFDFVSENSTWETAHRPTGDADGGVGYATADKPEGPWTVQPRPLLLNSYRAAHPLAGKYGRYYATTLLRRAHDWLLLTAVDSDNHHSWGMVAATAKNPAGPWSDPVLVLSPESDQPWPTPVEFFPAFVHDGDVHAPVTSVRANRNFMAWTTAALEKAHLPAAWKLTQSGNLWHAEDRDWEAYGLWGQTISGQVIGTELIALFPTRDRNGLSSVGLARRPWATPFRDQLTVSGHTSGSVVHLARGFSDFHWTATITHRGLVALRWAVAKPTLGAPGSQADQGPSPQCYHGAQGLEVEEARWALVVNDHDGARTVVAEGQHGGATEIVVDRTATGMTSLMLDGKQAWQGQMPPASGGLGLATGPWSHLTMSRCALSGTHVPVTTTWLAAEGISGAGEAWDDWTTSTAGIMRRKAPGGRAKWTFTGTSVSMSLPHGPNEPRLHLTLDGRDLGVIDLKAASASEPTLMVLATKLSPGPHALVLTAERGLLIAGNLEAAQP